jgi:hypothetical protein
MLDEPYTARLEVIQAHQHTNTPTHMAGFELTHLPHHTPRRAIPLGDAPVPEMDPQQKLQQKMLTGTQRDIGNVQRLLAEEKDKAEQLEAKVNTLRLRLGKVKTISTRGSIKVSLSKKGGAKLGIKMAMDSGVDAIVVTDVIAGGQAEGLIPARARLQTINGTDVAELPFAQATKLISDSGDIVSFTFSPAIDAEEANGASDGGISFVAGKSATAATAVAAAKPVLVLGSSSAPDPNATPAEKKVTLVKEDGVFLFHSSSFS